jgi:hypothetical protein
VIVLTLIQRIQLFRMRKSHGVVIARTFDISVVRASLLLLVFALFDMNVRAFPTGAGGCAGNMAAVGGTHLDNSNGRPVSNNTLLAGGVDVRIGNVTLETDSPHDFATGVNHTITILSTQFPVRGILIRLQAPDGVDTANVLTPALQMKVADVCVSPIVGTTHFNNSEKVELSSIVRFDEAIDSVYLDITGVFINNAEGSVYVYSRYAVNFISEGNTPAPTASPTTAAPVMTPMDLIPTTAPVTEMPVLPTTVPTMMETVPPSAAPVSLNPTKTPQVTPKPSSTSPGSPSLLPETQVPSCSEMSLEPSLRGGVAKGMMNGMGKGKGGLCNEDGMMSEGKGMKGKMSIKEVKYDMKKPKEDDKKQMEMR